MARPFALLLLALVSALAPSPAWAQAKKPYEVYAQFVQNTPVELSNGALWMMDKGDCFPVYMFKDQQTKVVLQLATVTFKTEMRNVRILKEKEHPAALVSYRKNLSSFLDTQARNWREGAKPE